MRKLLVLLHFLTITSAMFGQHINGTWYSTLRLPGNNHLAVVFHVTKSGTAYSATMDSPNQDQGRFHN